MKKISDEVVIIEDNQEEGGWKGVAWFATCGVICYSTGAIGTFTGSMIGTGWL